MNSSILLVCIFIGSVVNSFSQTKDSLNSNDKSIDHFGHVADTFFLTKNKAWAKNSKTKTFENQGMYHSTYLALNNDSSFIFFSIYEVGESLTTGKWEKITDSTYRFQWNKNKSIDLCKQEFRLKKYYRYGFPKPYKIESWVFTMHKTKLTPTINYKKVRLYQNGL